VRFAIALVRTVAAGARRAAAKRLARIPAARGAIAKRLAERLARIAAWRPVSVRLPIPERLAFAGRLALSGRALRLLREWIEAAALPIARFLVAVARSARAAIPIRRPLVSLAFSTRQLLEARALLIARLRVLRARVLVIAAGTPVSRPPLARRLAVFERRLARRKDLPALDPDDRRVGLLRLHLLQRRQQIFPVASAKRRRLPAGDDRPISRSRHKFLS